MSTKKLMDDIRPSLQRTEAVLGEILQISGQQHLASPETQEWSEIYFRSSEAASHLAQVKAALKNHSAMLYATDLTVQSAEEKRGTTRYKPHHLPAGSVVYVNADAQNPDEAATYYCAHCHQNGIVSILQPGKEIEGHRSLHCPQCKNDYKFEAIPNRVMFFEGKPRGCY
ncbi:hypothetical protein [Pantoea stewartii]|uniref:Uncharacterized protein n=1 Tax=Pantoea stewartii subsp. stewartii DC283 TaxID=660596 RepID=H3R9S1_PANSE|nr:hypothetical protein [Pantoea stewartii]ARF51383.1 hypothetical protein DSJ_20040 [Pantoea stewartii subsp. stewartii DC283]EHU01934.1 hypothetical protein CKS_0403 [Pantoea stewartii subsp. stewartii DC283]